MCETACVRRGERYVWVDRHDTVMRLNNAPTLGYEQFVGNYTSHRLINNKWATVGG